MTVFKNVRSVELRSTAKRTTCVVNAGGHRTQVQCNGITGNNLDTRLINLGRGKTQAVIAFSVNVACEINTPKSPLGFLTCRRDI